MVGIVFIIISQKSGADAAADGDDGDTIDIPDGVSHFFESLVGVFMILLGIYGIRRALEHKNKSYGTLPGSLAGIDSMEGRDDDEEQGQDSDARLSYHNHAAQLHLAPQARDALEMGDQVPSSETRTFLGRVASTVSTQTMALFAGVIHGLAGPGGVLGVIPAVQLHNGRLAAIYLGCFCLSSTVTMGTFAVVYGACSTRVGETMRSSFVIEMLSAGLSILVGITWLVLLSVGKLEDVFP